MSKPRKAQIPDGYKKDAQGKLVPIDMIKDIDKQRDELVLGLIKEAQQHHEALVKFKSSAMSNIQKFIDESGKKYGVKMGGNKGNVTLLSFDGRFKVQRSIAEYLVFDERLQVAKELIDQCIHEWTEGSRSEIRVLINDAFQVDKEGKVSTTRILGLKRLDIKNLKWKKAMQAISDSILVSGSKSYVRVYERVGESDQYKPISLDMAVV